MNDFTKRLLQPTTALLPAVAVALAISTPTAAKERFTKGYQSPYKITIPDNARRNFKSTMKLNSPRHSSVVIEDMLISEDFEYFEEGTNDAPDTEYLLASSNFEPGIYIDTDLTKQPGWWGDWVYSAGGACALMCPDYNNMGYIATPLGDYSGEVTISFKAKAFPCEVTGTSVMVAPYVNCGTSAPKAAETDGTPNDCNVRLYPDQGWTNISYTFKNYSADPDGSIIISCTGWAIIDDIQVNVRPTFIAQPVVKPLSDIKADSFTINWNPVRKSFNYWIDLYKKVYKSTEPASFRADFENGLPPESDGWTFFANAENNITEDKGNTGSRGLLMRNGDSFTCPADNSTLKTFKMWMRAYNDNPDAELDGRLQIEVLDNEGWSHYGTYDLYFFTGDNADNFIDIAAEAPEFTDAYKCIRFTLDKLSEGTYAVIDDCEALFSPEFEMVEQENPDEEEGFYEYYYATVNRDKELSYTFSDLDPEGDYYYRVRAHYVNTFSDSKLHHAFFVSTPQVKNATEIEYDSYTANWEASPKATKYSVRNFGRQTIDEDDWYAILSEDFSKIDSSITEATDPYSPETLWNYPETDLDEYTIQPGWRGLLNTTAIGMLGCEDSQMMTTYIITPLLDLTNNTSTRIRIKAHGYEDSGLIVRGGGKTYLINYTSDGDGTRASLDGYVDLDITGLTTLMFYDYGMAPFMIDEIEIGQYLSKGDYVHTLLDTKEVDAPATSCTFENLDKDEYADYDYDVTAIYELDGETTKSSPSGRAWVNLITKETSGISEASVSNIVVEKARYTADGIRLSKPAKGLNIVVTSDGSVIKQMVR